MPLIVATGNPGKLREFEQFFQQLGCHPWQLQLKPAELDVDETGQTFADNALLKARGVATALGEWAIADDSGLAVDALNGAPGVHSARYAPTTAERNSKLLQALEGSGDRAACFICEIVLCRPDGSVAATATGRCRGEIAPDLQGSGGFGYDPLFYVPEAGMTFAQMSPEQKQRLGHRGKALQQLRSRLQDLDFATLQQ
nr:RdgB/HAM1 family non-canonical purine NTP pyrophosphatase [Synechococcus sp. PCC 7336]